MAADEEMSNDEIMSDMDDLVDSEMSGQDEEQEEQAEPTIVTATLDSAADILTSRDDSTTKDTTNTQKSSKRLPITVTKPIPYTFDLGNLLCTDANPLPPADKISDQDISTAARDCAQVLVNQLLSTCPITRSSDNTSITLTLPAPTTLLPREKPIPKDKPLTKWQEFAKKKGIQNKKKETGDLVYDEAKGDWVRKWGYKGKNKADENAWLVEVDDKKATTGATGKKGAKGDAEVNPRTVSRQERKERVRRQERKMRSNEKRAAAAA